LEDTFDSANRKNLRHFIVSSKEIKHEEVPIARRQSEASSDAINEEALETEKHDSVLYYLSSEGEKDEARHELVRIPTCAIFHKLSRGRGVPHTFMGKSLVYRVIVANASHIRLNPSMACPAAHRGKPHETNISFLYLNRYSCLDISLCVYSPSCQGPVTR
jgi:hypothetical protein